MPCCIGRIKNSIESCIIVEHEEGESVDWLLTFEEMDEQNNPRQWQSRTESRTASQGMQGLNEWRAGTTSPDQGIPCISNSASSRYVFQSIFLLFALIMCYSPFHRRTKMGSKESTVSIVQSIHDTSRDSFKGNFNKGGFCVMNRHSLRTGIEAHAIQPIHWIKGVLMGNWDENSHQFLLSANSFRMWVRSIV